MDAGRLHTLRWRLGLTVPLLGWLRRRAVRELLADCSAPAVRALLEVLPRRGEPELKAEVLAGLRALAGDEVRLAVCQEWERTGLDVLAEQVRAWGWVPPGPARVRVLCALKLGRLDLLAEGGEEEVAHLVAACDRPDPEVATRAPLALRSLRGEAGREAVCRLAIDEDSAAALAAARAAGYLPAEAGRRALFLFLTGRWDEYDALDFDRGLLRGAYQVAREVVRRRVAERVRQSGRADLLPVLTGGPAVPRRGRLSEQEWQVTLDLLARTGQDERLWGLTWTAPPWCVARVLRLLRERGWCPTAAAERADFHALADLAAGPAELDCGRPSLWAEGAPAAERPFAADVRATLREHTDVVRCLSVSPGGRLLASTDEDGKVCVWGLPEGRLLQTFDAGAPGTCVLFTAAGEEIISGHQGGQAHVWPLAGGRRALTIPLLCERVWCLALSPDGALLAADHFQGARVWGLADGQLVVKCGGLVVSQAHDLAFSPDGTTLAALCSRHMTRLKLWDLPTGRLQANVAVPSIPNSLAFRDDGRVLLTSSYHEQKLRLWAPADARPAGEVAGHYHWSSWPDFEPDAPWRRACLGGSSGERARLGRLPDGRLLLARRRKRSLRVWVPGDLAVEKWEGPGERLTCLAAAQGVVAAGAADGAIRLWGLPFREEALGQVPVADMTLTHWDWVRRRLREADTPVAERRGLAFVDALLRRRWRHEVHVEEARPALPLEHDIYIEG
jgi:WD40 repeat protein